MFKTNEIGLNSFLQKYPEMALKPSRQNGFIISGTFVFYATTSSGPEIRDKFDLKINVPEKFPEEIPTVEEIGGKIPRDGQHHVNPDGTLCLGSPLRLIEKISIHSTLSGFTDECLIPFLYAVSHKLQFGGKFFFGELAHGNEGIIDDYLEIFGVKTHQQIMDVFDRLSLKKRVANKKDCPCQCGQRLGKCSLRMTINRYRKLKPRSWYRQYAKTIDSGIK